MKIERNMVCKHLHCMGIISRFFVLVNAKLYKRMEEIP